MQAVYLGCDSGNTSEAIEKGENKYVDYLGEELELCPFRSSLLKGSWGDSSVSSLWKISALSLLCWELMIIAWNAPTLADWRTSWTRHHAAKEVPGQESPSEGGRSLDAPGSWGSPSHQELPANLEQASWSGQATSGTSLLMLSSSQKLQWPPVAKSKPSCWVINPPPRDPLVSAHPSCCLPASSSNTHGCGHGALTLLSTSLFPTHPAHFWNTISLQMPSLKLQVRRAPVITSPATFMSTLITLVILMITWSLSANLVRCSLRREIVHVLHLKNLAKIHHTIKSY